MHHQRQGDGGQHGAAPSPARVDRAEPSRPVKGRTSRASTFSAAPNRPCSPPSSVPASISLVSAAPTYCRSSANPLPPPYPDNSPVCAASASSSASSAPIATISPALVAPPSLPAADSPKTPLFL